MFQEKLSFLPILFTSLLFIFPWHTLGQENSVFAHKVEGDLVRTAVQLKTEQPVANAPIDRFAFPMGDRIMVLANGNVYAHKVEGDLVRTAVQLKTEQPVANAPIDRFAFPMGDRIMVLADGWVHSHKIEGNLVRTSVQLTREMPVANSMIDRFCFPGDGRIFVTTWVGQRANNAAKVIYQSQDPTIKISVPFKLFEVGAKFVSHMWVLITEEGGKYRITIRGWGYVRSHGHKLWEDTNLTLLDALVRKDELKINRESSITKYIKLISNYDINIRSNKINISVDASLAKEKLNLFSCTINW